MGIKQLYNDNLRKLPNKYGDVSIMIYANKLPLLHIHEVSFNLFVLVKSRTQVN